MLVPLKAGTGKQKRANEPPHIVKTYGDKANISLNITIRQSHRLVFQ